MRDYDGSELPVGESSNDFAAVPDSFQRLWTPHRIAYNMDHTQTEKDD